MTNDAYMFSRYMYVLTMSLYCIYHSVGVGNGFDSEVVISMGNW